jgi:hypothetical protein
VLSSYKFDDYLDAKLGVVNGSQTDNNTTTSGGGDGCAVLAALNVTAPGGNANWSNNFQYSSNNDNNTVNGTGSSSTSTAVENGSSGTGYTFIYNSWGNWAPKFANDKLLFAFNALLGTASTNDGDPSQPGTTWFGAGAYAKYQFNDWFSLCSRGEYLGGNNPAKVTDNYNNQNLSLWEYTLTAGFNVIEAGTVVGKMGMTGFATGKHLHWEIWAGHITSQPLAGFATGKGYYNPMDFCKAVMAFEKANVEAHKETSEKATVTVAPSHSVDDIPTVAVPKEAKVVKPEGTVAPKKAVVAAPVVAKIANPGYPGHYLKLGSKGEEVKFIQQQLKIVVTGNFEAGTDKAVKVLQKKHGLLVDGIVGPKTWALLD